MVAGLLIPFAAPSALAAGPYYWDCNDGTAGFGTAQGTWSAPTIGATTNGWSTDSAGSTVVNGNSVTTATGEALNFGNGATGLAAGTITVSGTVDAGNITFASGSGAIVLSGGTINLAASETITVNNTSNTISSILTGAATTLTKAGSGTLVLGGTNTFTGAISVNGGTLMVDYASGFLNSVCTLTLGGGTLNLEGTTDAKSQTLGNLTITAATDNHIVINQNGGAGMALTLGNTWTRGNNSTLNIDLSSGGGAVLNSSPTMANSIVPGGYSYATVTDATGTGFATVTNGNVVRYALATTLTNNSNNGNVNFKTRVGDPGYVGNTMTMTAANRNVNTLELDTSGGTGILDLGGTAYTLDFTGHAILVTGTNSFTIRNGYIGWNQGENLVHQYSTGTLTISAWFPGPSSPSLVKDGPGTLVLNATNGPGLYTLYVNQGVLRLTSTNPLSTAVVDLPVQNGGALELAGGLDWNSKPLTLNGTGISSGGALRNISDTNTYGATITLGTGGARINSDSGLLTVSNIVTAAGKDLTVGGVGNVTVGGIISGAGGLIKDGNGTMILTTDNTYTGITTISGGTLAAVMGGSCSNSAVTVASAGTLQIPVTDTNKPWTCASLALNNDSPLKFDCQVVPPSTNVAPLNITGNLTFSGNPVITLAPDKIVPGTYPLLVVGGTAPTEVPKLSGPFGSLTWGGVAGSRTLSLNVFARGTVLIIR